MRFNDGTRRIGVNCCQLVSADELEAEVLRLFLATKDEVESS